MINRGCVLDITRLEWVESYEYLGTIVDSKLNFEANSEAFCKKGSPAFVLFKKNFLF